MDFAPDLVNNRSDLEPFGELSAAGDSRDPLCALYCVRSDFASKSYLPSPFYKGSQFSKVDNGRFPLH